MDPAATPHRKQKELVRSELITFSIPTLVNISHVSIDACTIPLLYTPTCRKPHLFPYATILDAIPEQQSAHENMNSSTSPETKLTALADPRITQRTVCMVQIQRWRVNEIVVKIGGWIIPLSNGGVMKSLSLSLSHGSRVVVGYCCLDCVWSCTN